MTGGRVLYTNLKYILKVLTNTSESPWIYLFIFGAIIFILFEFK